MTTSRRPVRNTEGFLLAYKLWSQDESIGTIIQRTKVSDKTITNWVNMFKEAPEEETAKDKPFHFFGLKAFPSFDWTLSDRMREVTGEFKNEKGEKLIPTFRQAFWALDLSFSIDLYTDVHKRNKNFIGLVNTMVDHEIEELHGQPTQWASEELSKAFEKLLESGKRLKQVLKELEEEKVNESQTNSKDTRHVTRQSEQND